MSNRKWWFVRIGVPLVGVLIIWAVASNNDPGAGSSTQSTQSASTPVPVAAQSHKQCQINAYTGRPVGTSVELQSTCRRVLVRFLPDVHPPLQVSKNRNRCVGVIVARPVRPDSTRRLHDKPDCRGFELFIVSKVR